MQNLRPILVQAATGKTGRRVAELLEAKGFPVRRGSRSAEIPFDWHDRSTWGPALDGVDAVYLVYTPDLAVPTAPPEIRAFCEVAVEQGVRRIVVLSGRGEVEAHACERIIQESGLEWVVVRGSWFNQNFDEGEFAPMVFEGNLTLPADDIPEPFVDVNDIAEVAAAALTEERHAGEIYEVSGPRALTFTDVAKELSAASGREIVFTRIPAEAFTGALKEAGLSDELVGLMDYLFGTVLDGRNSQPTDGVRRALGREPRDFADWAREAAGNGSFIPSEQEA